MLTKNAVGNLINRYKSVLAKCRVLNTVGSLALATLMATGMATAGLTMGLGNAYAAYDTTPTLDATDIKSAIVDTVGGLDKNLAKPKYYDKGRWKTYDTWSAYATDLETILKDASVSSAYTVTSGVADADKDDYYTTFIVKDASGTETTYGIKLKNSLVDAKDTTGTSSSINALITAYSKGDYTITSNDASAKNHTFSVEIDGTTCYFNVEKNGKVVHSKIEGTEKNNNYTGDFIGNSAYLSGGAISSYYSAIGSITGNFIGNSTRNSGGAIYNGSSIGTIVGHFIGNTAEHGGAIYNEGSIGSISGDFISNRASSTRYGGGAIYNYGKSSIGSITGDFIGNSAKYGGAILNHNSSTIGSITGDFILNSAEYGGAIYNDESSTIDSINGDFIGNKAKDNGGAIYTANSLTFNATKDMQFTDNIAGSAYNAIYVDGKDVDLTFTMADNYSITMNDSISGSKLYDVAILGTGADKNTFYLNDAMINVDTLTVLKSTLSLGSYTHGDDKTTTYGTISAYGDVRFEADSKLVVDGSIYTKDNGVTAAITGNSSATFEADALSKLELKNVGEGSYTILDGFSITEANTAWSDVKVTVANVVYKVVDTLNSDGSYTVTVAIDKTSSALASVKASTQASMIGILSDKNNPAFNKVNSILEDGHISKNKRAVAAEHAMSGRSADAATAAFSTTAGAHDVITSQLSSTIGQEDTLITERDSSDTSTMTASADGAISDAPNSSYLKENGMLGLHVWAMPFYQNHNSDGLKSNSTSTDSENNFGGLVLGLDKTFGDWRVGLAVNAGSGAIKSTSAYATTDTDYDFWGVNLYAGRTFGDFGLTAQVGYSHGDYESYIDQSTDGADSELDMTSHTYAASVRGTYDIALDFATFTPYVGLGYMHFVLDDCDLKSVSDGSKAAKIATDDQDIWTVPFGVTISKDFAHNDWTLTPALDLGGILAMGDLESHAVSRSGAASPMPIDADVVDDWTFDAGLSLTAVKGVATINLGYDLQVSEHMTNHGVFARIGYSF